MTLLEKVLADLEFVGHVAESKKKWISVNQETMYLGYKITAAGIFPGPEKVHVMEALSIPPYWCREAPSNWTRFEKHREKTLASII